jgi:ankyrin repeat protein
MHAISNGRTAAARALIDMGADVTIRARDGSTALSIARSYLRVKQDVIDALGPDDILEKAA